MSDISTEGGPVTYQPNLTWQSPEYILRATNKGTLEDGDAFWDSDAQCFKVRSNGKWETLRPWEPEPAAPAIEPVPCPMCTVDDCETCHGSRMLTAEQVYALARLVVGARTGPGGHNIEIGPETARSYLGYADTVIHYLWTSL